MNSAISARQVKWHLDVSVKFKLGKRKIGDQKNIIWLKDWVTLSEKIWNRSGSRTKLFCPSVSLTCWDGKEEDPTKEEEKEMLGGGNQTWTLAVPVARRGREVSSAPRGNQSPWYPGSGARCLLAADHEGRGTRKWTWETPLRGEMPIVGWEPALETETGLFRGGMLLRPICMVRRTP